jgi:uncharacterized protein YcgI (DUF1989 family)
VVRDKFMMSMRHPHHYLPLIKHRQKSNKNMSLHEKVTIRAKDAQAFDVAADQRIRICKPKGYQVADKLNSDIRLGEIVAVIALSKLEI